MEKQRLILASESIFRKTMMQQAGFNFEVMPANIDEKAIRSKSAEALTLALASAKANKIVFDLMQKNEKAIVIAADQVMVWNGHILEKPKDYTEAKEFLTSYKFQNPFSVVGVCVYNMYNFRCASQVEKIEIEIIKEFSDDEIDMIAREPSTYTACGAFPTGLETDLACRTVSAHMQIPENKESSVAGLPIPLVIKLLSNAGYRVSDEILINAGYGHKKIT